MLADYESLRQLPVAEKLQVIEMLWHDIESSREDFPITDEVLEEVDRRVAEFHSNPTETISREELWKRVDARRG
jgi:putative addiction module component (TIGR02574 family)